MVKPFSYSTVLITRPRAQAQMLAEKIQQLGGNPFVFPTLEILPASNQQSLLQVLNTLPQVHLAIFVSANAARYALPFYRQPFPSCFIIAVGPATAKACQSFGINVDLIPSCYDSESILSLDHLQTVQNKKIVIFCGENSRPLLRETLRARGAVVTEAISYRRICPQYDMAQELPRLKTAQIQAIISTSNESLQNLYLLFSGVKEGLNWLKNIPIFVISSRMQDQAQQLGLTSRLVANPTDEAILQALF